MRLVWTGLWLSLIVLGLGLFVWSTAGDSAVLAALAAIQARVAADAPDLARSPEWRDLVESTMRYLQWTWQVVSLGGLAVTILSAAGLLISLLRPKTDDR